MNCFKIFHSFLVLTILFSAISTINAGVNECLYAWNERANEPEQCKVSADCQGENAKCVFSPVTNHYICCAPKKHAVQPKCPAGMSLHSRGKTSEVIICDKTENAPTEEQCPYNFECVESVTDFTKYPGQSNQVCCVREKRHK